MGALELAVRDRVAYLTLNRPAAFNGLDDALLDELERALPDLHGTAGLRAAVVTGAGPAFCVGLDINLLKRAFNDLDYFRATLDRVNAILFAVEALPFPVVTAVNGLARAGGFELILASDLTLIAEEARIGDVHTPFGIIPGGGATQRLPRRIGPQRATEVILTGRWLSGAEAVAYGLALRAAPRADLMDEVERLVDHFRAKHAPALAEAKAAIRGAATLSLRKGVTMETDRLMRLLTEDPASHEGINAYLERRPPRWP